MNGLDYAIVAIIGLGALYGLMRGALRILTSILSLVVAIYLASTYYQQVGAYVQRQFGTSPTTGAIVGYAAIFAVIFVIVEFAGRRVIRLTQIIHLGWIDRLGGGIFGGAIAAVIAGLAVVMLATILPDNPPMLRNSQLAPRVLAFNDAMLGFVPPQVRSVYESKRDELTRYWAEKTRSPAIAPSSTR
ncbi:MAG: CvpA family protein [Candidatus Binataceae bacterium]